MADVRPARGLLLDIGGVVVTGGGLLVDRLAAREPELKSVVEAVGGLSSERDELWQQVLRHEVGERDYWARRAAELGAAVGQSWATLDLMHRLYVGEPSEWLNEPVTTLMHDVKAAGLALGALTNDMADFHGQEWVDAQRWLDPFDVIVDASHTKIMKPDPRAFAAGAAALGLPPSEIVFLDDQPWNVAGGLEAGLRAVRVDLRRPGLAVAEARRQLGLSGSDLG